MSDGLISKAIKPFERKQPPTVRDVIVGGDRSAPLDPGAHAAQAAYMQGISEREARGLEEYAQAKAAKAEAQRRADDLLLKRIYNR